MTRRHVRVALALALAFATGACRGDDTTSPTADPGVVHVHGLGIDPGDGTLYAATHNGLFEIPESGRATRIGDRYQDTMGFTVIGPRHFLASGHPDMADDDLFEQGTPPHLGLIESTDGGESWKKRSLFGQADFHAIVAAHARVYAYDSTGARLLVSSDNTNWETRNEGILLGALAVDPGDPNTIVAATEAGPEVSRDGGRTFAALDGAPVLAMVAWDETRGIWGVTFDGGVHHASAVDGPWTKRGVLPGAPEAFAIDGDTLYAAAGSPAGTAIVTSDDDGATWQLRYRDPRQ